MIYPISSVVFMTEFLEDVSTVQEEVCERYIYLNFSGKASDTFLTIIWAEGRKR